jgi:hypothetical protein
MKPPTNRTRKLWTGGQVLYCNLLPTRDWTSTQNIRNTKLCVACKHSQFLVNSRSGTNVIHKNTEIPFIIHLPDYSTVHRSARLELYWMSRKEKITTTYCYLERIISCLSDYCNNKINDTIRKRRSGETIYRSVGQKNIGARSNKAASMWLFGYCGQHNKHVHQGKLAPPRMVATWLHQL